MKISNYDGFAPFRREHSISKKIDKIQGINPERISYEKSINRLQWIIFHLLSFLIISIYSDIIPEEAKDQLKASSLY